jgi:chromosome segregation ATPase
MGRKIELELRVKNALARGLKSAGAALQQFGRSAMRIGKAFATAFIGAGAAVAGFAAKALSAYSQQEAAEKLLTSALRAHGDEIENNMARLNKAASAIQDETGAADENTMARMARLRMLGVEADQLEMAARATIALKSAGMEEEAAIKAVAMARAGEYGMLTQYIPALRQATTEAEKARIVNDFLTKGYAQQKAALNTVSGQWAALKGRVGDAWEEVGKAISQSGNLQQVLKQAGDAVKAFGESVKNWIEGGGVDRAVETVKLFFSNVREAFGRIASYKVDVQLGLVTAAAVALVVKLVALSKHYKILAVEINAATIAKAKNAVAAAISAIKLNMLGTAAAGAAVKIAALKVAIIALKGVGVAGIAIGFVAIANAALKAREAAIQLQKSLKNAEAQRTASQRDFGAPPNVLKLIREAQEAGDEKTLKNLEARYPKAVAMARERRGVEKETTEEIEDQAEAVDQIAIAQESATKAAEDRADAEKKAQEEAEAAREASYKRMTDLEQEVADKRKELAQENIDRIKEQLAEQEKLAGQTVDEFLADTQDTKDDQKQQQDDWDKFNRLKKKEGKRGTTLSKKDQEWLDAFRGIEDAQQKAGDLRGKLGQAEYELQLMEGQTKTLESMLTELEGMHADLKDNLTASRR